MPVAAHVCALAAVLLGSVATGFKEEGKMTSRGFLG